MNLQSNALKFTKQGGSVVISAKLIKSKEFDDNKKEDSIKSKGQRDKKYQIYHSFGSSDSSEDSMDSEELAFEQEHGIKNIE